MHFFVQGIYNNNIQRNTSLKSKGNNLFLRQNICLYIIVKKTITIIFLPLIVYSLY